VPTLQRDGDIAVLHIGSDENRFTPDWLDAMHTCLDELEGLAAPAALVTVAEGKFWSNGLDLDWLSAHLDEAESYVESVQRLLSRVTALGMHTVAAIQGHCFAAGAMLALAHDWRVMRADRGFFCLPEVDIAIPFTIGMDALIRAKLDVAVAHEAMTTGRRYGGRDAQASGIVTTAVDESAVRSAAVELARPLAGKAGQTLATIKSRMYAEAVAGLASTESSSLARGEAGPA
jgi:enoyl-CoA hydratase/carnithine racemase